MARGPLIILSGPSGSGKSTLIRRLIKMGNLPLHLSVSATTREPRERDGVKEIDGTHYHFWTEQRFQEELAQDGFLEWAHVHDHHYGTLRSEVEPNREKGIGVILDIDVQGWEKVRHKCPDHLSIFLRPSSTEVLKKRLERRGTETPEQIQRRLDNATKELPWAEQYHKQLVNDDLEEAVQELHDLVKAAFEN